MTGRHRGRGQRHPAKRDNLADRSEHGSPRAEVKFGAEPDQERVELARLAAGGFYAVRSRSHPFPVGNSLRNDSLTLLAPSASRSAQVSPSKKLRSRSRLGYVARRARRSRVLISRVDNVTIVHIDFERE